MPKDPELWDEPPDPNETMTRPYRGHDNMAQSRLANEARIAAFQQDYPYPGESHSDFFMRRSKEQRMDRQAEQRRRDRYVTESGYDDD